MTEAAGGPGVTARRVLVALDASFEAAALCVRAAELAQCMGATLTALHVAVPVWPLSSFERDHDAAVRAEEGARGTGRAVLDEARQLVPAGVPFSAELQFGDPADVIIERAEALAVDLIVVGSRRRGLMETLLLGSVSSAVVHRATCSVMVIRDGSAAG